MSIWVELRCEDSTEDYADGGYVRNAEGIPEMERCWSLDNSGLGQLAGDTAESLRETYSDIRQVAKRCGWVQAKSGWICPFCANQRKNLDGN